MMSELCVQKRSPFHGGGGGWTIPLSFTKRTTKKCFNYLFIRKTIKRTTTQFACNLDFCLCYCSTTTRLFQLHGFFHLHNQVTWNTSTHIFCSHGFAHPCVNLMHNASISVPKHDVGPPPHSGSTFLFVWFQPRLWLCVYSICCCC